ncbi:MAG: hypothetical protein WDN72_05410 [Alphaproteobacteria bacterium]
MADFSPGIVVPSYTVVDTQDPRKDNAEKANFDAIGIRLNAANAPIIQGDRAEIADAVKDKNSWFFPDTAKDNATIAKDTAEIARLNKENNARTAKLESEIKGMLDLVPEDQRAQFLKGFLEFHGLKRDVAKNGAITYTPVTKRDPDPTHSYVPRALDPNTRGI